MSVFLCVSILVLTLLGAELQASVRLHADIPKNRIESKILLFGLSIMRVIISFSELDIANKYVRLKVNGKEIGIALTTDRDNADSVINYMTNPIMNAIDFKYFNLTVTAGVNNDPFASAMLLQVMRTAYASAVAFIKNRQDLDTDQRFIMNYANNNFEAEFFGIIGLTIANIIFSFFVALARKIKNKVKNGRNNDNKYRTETD